MAVSSHAHGMRLPSSAAYRLPYAGCRLPDADGRTPDTDRLDQYWLCHQGQMTSAVGQYCRRICSNEALAMHRLADKCRPNFDLRIVTLREPNSFDKVHIQVRIILHVTLRS